MFPQYVINKYEQIREDMDSFIKENVYARVELETSILQHKTNDARRIIFGAGYCGKKLLLLLDQYKIQVDMFFDNRADNIESIGGVSVVKPDAKYLTDNIEILISNMHNQAEIISQLRSLGVKEKNIYCYSQFLR